MHVACSLRRSSVSRVATAISRGSQAVLIAGAPGFGKTSVLSATVRRVSTKLGLKVLWINGAIVGSEAHLARIIAGATAGSEDERAEADPKATLRRLLSAFGTKPRGPSLLAVDDVDALFFKRQQLAAVFGDALAADTNMRFLGTCHPSVCRRLMKASHFSRRLDGHVTRVPLSILGKEQAKELLRRRAPGLPRGLSSVVVHEAAGHPAALVFLARLASLHLDERTLSDRDVQKLLDTAGEFAGSVYAESWASRGPQQRAILWQLATASSPTTAASIASVLNLRAPQVSAQLHRLVAEGLVSPTAQRARYSVAPLLTRWISTRATRGRELDRDLPFAKYYSQTLAT